MGMAKLTLSVDPAVVERAKRYARQRRVSVSGLVEAYLGSLNEPAAAPAAPPVLRSLRGILKKADMADYRRHLVQKHR